MPACRTLLRSLRAEQFKIFNNNARRQTMAKKVVQMEQVAQGKVPITIRAPNFQIATFFLIGTSPYVQHRFSAKAMEQMIAKQESGQRAKKGTTREAKDFNQVYKDAMYISTQGWHGVPASSFRNAMISA